MTDDDPTQAVTVPSPKLVMAEGDATYTVKLSRQPGATVTVTIARAAGGAEEVLFHTGGTGATYSAASKTLSFTTGNWDTTQTVYVRANDTEDAIETDTLSHTLSGRRHQSGQRPGPGSRGSETGHRPVPQPAPWSLDEGSTANYTVKLNAPPSAAVTVTVSRSNDLDEVQFSATASGTYANSLELTFTTENWNTAQTLYVRAGEDNTDSTNESGTITHTASATGGYTASITATRSVTVDDNDDPGLTINPSPLSLNEGRNASYTVRLVTRPSTGNNVTVAIERQTGTGASNAVEFNTDNGSDYYTTGQTLTFTDSNWNRPQRVYVRAATDSDGDNERDVLTHDMSGSTDTVYSGLAADELTVNVTDTVSAGLLFSPGNLSVPPGSSRSYNIRLTAPPAGDVMVTPASDNSAVTIESPTPLTFTASDWNEAQQVEVMAAAGAATGTEATVSHNLSSSGDANYNEQTFTDGNVTVTINNAPAPATAGGGFGSGGGFGGSGGGGGAAPAAAPPDIEFSVASIAMDEGMAAAYRVRLSAAPPAKLW